MGQETRQLLSMRSLTPHRTGLSPKVFVMPKEASQAQDTRKFKQKESDSTRTSSFILKILARRALEHSYNHKMPN